MVLAGKGSLNWDAGDMPISKGITLLIPATLDSVRIRPDEPLTLLEISTDS
jgi:mannose-6-phosphate isomerase class I